MDRVLHQREAAHISDHHGGSYSAYISSSEYPAWELTSHWVGEKRVGGAWRHPQPKARARVRADTPVWSQHTPAATSRSQLVLGPGERWPSASGRPGRCPLPCHPNAVRHAHRYLPSPPVLRLTEVPPPLLRIAWRRASEYRWSLPSPPGLVRPRACRRAQTAGAAAQAPAAEPALRARTRSPTVPRPGRRRRQHTGPAAREQSRPMGRVDSTPAPASRAGRCAQGRTPARSRRSLHGGRTCTLLLQGLLRQKIAPPARCRGRWSPAGADACTKQKIPRPSAKEC